ncbi:putative kirola-like [Capsicum annuum]|nr:putative kirola-like [Capsicum annuum]
MNFAPQSGNKEGYGHLVIGEEVNSDHVERFYMNTYPLNARQPHLIPKIPASLRESLEVYLVELKKVVIDLLGCIAETLEIDREVMLKMYEKVMQSVRMNYYPPYPTPNLVMGLAAHSVGSAITIVHQVDGVEGLEEENKIREAINEENEEIIPERTTTMPLTNESFQNALHDHIPQWCAGSISIITIEEGNEQRNRGLAEKSNLGTSLTT